MNLNQLQLNVEKIKYIIFKSRNKPDDYSTCTSFKGSSIEWVPTYKFLGVVFEENLSWTPHVNKLHANICKSISTLYNIRTLVPKWVKLQLYYALVHSHLHYCLLIWGTTTKTNLDRLTILQKRAVRCIENFKRIDHTAPFFFQTKHTQSRSVIPIKACYIYT